MEIAVEADRVIEINDSDFDTIIESEKPTLVDFWAPWCGPCKAIGPVVEDLAKEYGDKITVTKMNVDKDPVIPARYGIRAIPTIILFKGGEVVDQVTGAVGKADLVKLIEAI